MTEELKPCPFCGEEVEWREDKEDIYCPACEGAWRSIHWLENSTIHTWNRRSENDEKSEETARLIAAAPEMYELLRRVAYGSCDDCIPLMVSARELLARIEGKENSHE